jgi:hypothetical protein
MTSAHIVRTDAKTITVSDSAAEQPCPLRLL